MTAVTDYDSALEALLNSTEEMVTAAQIAPVLHMNPGVIIKYAKDGTWKPDIWGKFIISGERVKFFRRDFLQKCGFIPKDEPKRTVEDRLDELIAIDKDIQEGIHLMCWALKLWIHENKPAGAATPTD